MNKFILFLTFSMISFLNLHAQDFQGLVVYESKTSTSDFKLGDNKEIAPEMQKMIEERMKKFSEKTFNLYFDKTASIYEEQEKLDAPGTQNSGMKMMSSFAGGGGKLYKNVKEKIFCVDKEMMGKEFLVKDTLAKLKWKMETETKKIGNYTCYKATAQQAVSKSDFRNFRRKTQEENKDKKDDKEKSTNFMDTMELPKEVTITAWYTPEIPINQGPENYWGLPGLILEVNNGKTTILCSKVVMNNKDKKEIKAPINGKVVTQREYDEIVTKKIEEMKEMYKSQGGGGQGGMRFGR
ncbi:MAG: GLPGLI family protein [Flavobacterium sp.]|nr:GLPGLI family protein [Flavobacterium sp.]